MDSNGNTSSVESGATIRGMKSRGSVSAILFALNLETLKTMSQNQNTQSPTPASQTQILAQRLRLAATIISCLFLCSCSSEKDLEDDASQLSKLHWAVGVAVVLKWPAIVLALAKLMNGNATKVAVKHITQTKGKD